MPRGCTKCNEELVPNVIRGKSVTRIANPFLITKVILSRTHHLVAYHTVKERRFEVREKRPFAVAKGGFQFPLFLRLPVSLHLNFNLRSP